MRDDVTSAYGSEFPIPMRGNEETVKAEEGLRLHVSDPHEG